MNAERKSQRYFTISILVLFPAFLICAAFVDLAVVLGFFLCYLFGLVYIVLMRNLEAERKTYFLLFTFAFLLFSALSSLYFIGFLANYNELITPHRDDRQFLRYAHLFAITGEVTYSLFDVWNGVLYWVYSSVGISPNIYLLMPTVWLAASWVAVLVMRLSNGFLAPRVRFDMLVLVSLFSCYTYTYLATGLWRDLWGVLPLVYAVFLATKRRVILSSLCSIPAYLIRGANGGLALLSTIVIAFSLYLSSNRFLLIAGAVLGTYVAGMVADLMLPFLGSVFRDSYTIYGLLEGREQMMNRIHRENIGFDFTLFFYQLGPVGVPFRMVTGIFAPLRAPAFVGLIPEPYVSWQYIYGYSFVPISHWLHLLGLSFSLPHFINGIFLSYRRREFFPFLVLFVLLISIIVVFSLQDRHKYVYLWLCPVFVAMSVNQYASSRGVGSLIGQQYVRILQCIIFVGLAGGNLALRLI